MNPPSHPVSDLIVKILSTNNGYLFAPSEKEIDIAKAHPSVFLHVHKQGQEFFPHKISLK
jgi:hypothetical protein